MKKASRQYLADVKTHVESSVQVHTEITNTVNRLDDDAVDVDADVRCVKTLQLRSRPEAYEDVVRHTNVELTIYESRASDSMYRLTEWLPWRASVCHQHTDGGTWG